MLQDQVIPISLDGGIDTKTNPKVIVAGKFLFVENAVYTNPGEIEKRNGYTALPTAIMGGGSLTAPQMVRVYQGELICQDQGNLYGYSPSLQVWVNKGPYTSVDLSETFLYKENSVSGHVDCAVMGNYALYTWSSDPVLLSISTQILIVDLSSGSVLAGPTTLATITSPSPDVLTSIPRAVVLAGSTFAVSYINASSNLVIRTVSISSSGLSLGSEIPIETIGGINLVTVTPCDLAPTATGAVIAYQVGHTLKVKTLSSAGATVNTYSLVQTTTSTVLPVSIALDSSGNVWVYWADDTASSSGTVYVRYVILSSTLSVILSPTSIAALSNLQGVTQMAVVPVSTTQQTLYCGVVFKDSGSAQAIDVTQKINVPSNGASFGTLSDFAPGVYPYSRPFTVSGRNYAVFAYRGPTSSPSNSITGSQPTYFVIDLGSAAVIARFASGIAKTHSTLVPGYTPSVILPSSTKVIFACGIEFQFLTTQTLISGLVGAAAVTIDFGSRRAYRSTPSGGVLALNGGLVSMYDGQESAELGFHLTPEIVGSSVATTGGSVGTGTYSYVAVFQWTDAQGNLHQSAPSEAFSIVVSSGTTNKVSAYVSLAFLSQKQNVNIALFRASGTTYYQVTDPVAVQLSKIVSGNYFVAIVDTVSDPTGKQQLYTTGNVVENSSPPPSMIMESRQDRLWMVDSENPDTLWYTKSSTPGVGLSPSAFLQLQIDPKHGDIAGLSEMDDKMIVLKDRGVFFFAGDGANDTGAGSTLTTPQILPSDQGCNSLKSILLTPSGVFFKGPKGIYLLDRALQSHYVGAEVEKWNAQSITAATLVTDKSQIRFLTDSGMTLVYDYLLGKWAYFTNHQGYAADNYQGLYTYVRTDGNIYQENGTSFLDNATAFRLRARLGWLALAGVQGFQRVRRLGLLGDYSNGLNAGHGVQISAAYDFVESFLAAVSYLFGGASSAGTFQYRERLLQQKCDSLSLLIEEVTTGAAGESVALTNLSLEAGVKRGLRKAPASQTVG